MRKRGLRTPTSMLCGCALAAAAFAVSLLPANHAQAFGRNACYEVLEADEGPQVLRYVAKLHGRLTSLQELLEFEHPIQRTYTVHGKVVLNELTPIGIVDGTALVASGTGAALAVQIDLLGQAEFVKLDCTSDEASPTPTIWICEQLDVAAVDSVVAEDLVVLERRDPLDPEFSNCSVFNTNIVG